MSRQHIDIPERLRLPFSIFFRGDLVGGPLRYHDLFGLLNNPGIFPAAHL